MAKYLVEFKHTDSEGYMHSKKVYPDREAAIAQVSAFLDTMKDFDYLNVRQIKDKAVTAKKEAK